MSSIAGYDVAVVGAGPVGSLCALAHARNGHSVVLLEANPNTSKRLAGEWLHPPAVRILNELGLEPDGDAGCCPGKGFVVFPEDGGEPILLPYPDGRHGVAWEHERLVSRLRQAVEGEPCVDFMLNARVRDIEGDRVSFTRNGESGSVAAQLIVGADGRSSVVRQSLGLSTRPQTCSRMLGVMLNGVRLPFEGYGHVICAEPSPILIYRFGEHSVRLLVDLPAGHSNRHTMGALARSYADRLPDALGAAFLEALRERRFHAATNALRLRHTYGTPGRVLIGDAAGHYHPLTAVGMTLGFGDAFTLAGSGDFRDFARKRFQQTRAPELLAMGLYEVFADHRVEAVALRRTIYRQWREKPAVRDRTIRLLACEDTSVASLGWALGTIATRAAAPEITQSYKPSAWRRTRHIGRALAVRLLSLGRGMRQLRKAGGVMEKEERARATLSGAFPVSMPRPGPDAGPGRIEEPDPPDASSALGSATAHLLSLQRDNGAWEGEVVWCPMLTAQYVLVHHITQQPLDAARRRLVLRCFEQTRLESGTWGLHEHSTPHLFVTTLVYVAARLLGVERDDPRIEPARRFIQAEGVLNIPTWGKFWLALLNLYDWQGVNPVLPELWRLPRRLPLHPSNWYCHTRLIYMAMAAIYPQRFQAPVTPVIASLREELFGEGYADVDFAASRNRLRDADLFARPGVCLRAGYGLARWYERFGSKRLRDRCTAELVDRIRWELQTTDHTSISPVSGLLNILCLWLNDPDDADCRKALAQLEGWIWEDGEAGTRVAGARSASWDTGFALQALAAVPEVEGVTEALRCGADFLRRQQINTSFEGFREAFRMDPKGGWCFAGAWHGWPVTDCTAEAVRGMIAAEPGAASPEALGDAVRFMLRGQNRDGGFGSYESRRSAMGLEWLNPAEMFGESMTEHSHVECTASCLAAIAACRQHSPQVLSAEVASAVTRADSWLRRAQEHDGSWRGVWGVQYIYGTFFGIRGLLAAGAAPRDPALRAACRWLLDRQQPDGGWGEHHRGCLTGRYVAHDESQVIHTAWALIALLEAGDPDWAAIARGARFLIDTQDAEGQWPKQDSAGVFFRTALLDYVLYRQYFPLHALALYEQRRRAVAAS
ncbi:MAG: FAD-dependent monooxygenase [Acidimicrobiaceae bacterium]|nr:FAD-dependent monooxygenase [Acidimicrobiaceae bacterium]